MEDPVISVYWHDDVCSNAQKERLLLRKSREMLRDVRNISSYLFEMFGYQEAFLEAGYSLYFLLCNAQLFFMESTQIKLNSKGILQD